MIISTCTFYFYNKSHVSTIHFSKLSARVHSQHAHVEMIFTKTSKGLSQGRATASGVLGQQSLGLCLYTSTLPHV